MVCLIRFPASGIAETLSPITLSFGPRDRPLDPALGLGGLRICSHPYRKVRYTYNVTRLHRLHVRLSDRPSYFAAQTPEASCEFSRAKGRRAINREEPKDHGGSKVSKRMGYASTRQAGVWIPKLSQIARNCQLAPDRVAGHLVGMKTASVQQVPQRWTEILEWVAAGEEVEVTQQDKVVAKVVPAPSFLATQPDFLARAKAIWGEQPAGKPLSAVVAEARGGES